MPRIFADVLREALELSDSDRATLAGLLSESLEGEADRDVLEDLVSRDQATSFGPG